MNSPPLFSPWTVWKAGRRAASRVRCSRLMGSCLLGVVFAVLLSGCQRREPAFQDHARLEQLVPEVQSAVRLQLHEYFGTPAEPRAPHWLPLDTGQPRISVKPAAALSPASETQTIAVAQVSVFTSERFPLPISPVIAPEILRRELPSGMFCNISQPAQADVLGIDLGSQELNLSRAVRWPLENGFDLLVGEPALLKRGQALYERHCVMCHGTTGDGRGPQAHVLNPRPRDFRLGIFKYTSTLPEDKASTADLRETLKKGVAGTGMPAFLGLGESDLRVIAEYVKFLAIRGETELQLSYETEVDFSKSAFEEAVQRGKTAQEREQNRRQFVSEMQEFLDQEFEGVAYEITQNLSATWSQADEPDRKVQPQGGLPDPAAASTANPELTSLANGRRLYESSGTQCVSCHGQGGQGDGPQTRTQQNRPDGTPYPKPGLHDVWGENVKPRDLTYGVFHGGRDSEVLYRRIFAGVKGTPMPGYGGKGLSEAEIWDLVNYVLALAGEYPELPSEYESR